jgi:tRNA A-37 threonylcarbamoyl transferase component Bud32
MRVKYLFIGLFVLFSGWLESQQEFDIFIKTGASETVVLLDNEKVGETDEEGNTVINSVPAGEHKLRLEKNGYWTIKEQIEVGKSKKDNKFRTIFKFSLILKNVSDDTGNSTSHHGITVLIFVVILGAVGSFIFAFYLIKRDTNKRLRLGEFRLLKEIGKGGFAKVYKAKELAANKIVALKLMRREMMGNTELEHDFLREGELISRINERFPDAPIVKVYDYGKDNKRSCGIPYISMEYLKGDSLLNIIKRGGELTLFEKIWIIKEVSRGIKAVHKLKIVHGDMTPDNIIINKEKITLVDFGVALQKLDGRKEIDPGITGKPIYMSPEQCAGKKITGKSDVYSIGVIFFMLIYGMPPFKDKDYNKILRMHREDAVPDIDIPAPPEIKKLVRKLLEKNPGDRPTVARLERNLDKLISKGLRK